MVLAILKLAESYLFHFEYVLVEVLLELLVGKIDAELLERIFGKHFKSKNVQDSDSISLREMATDSIARVRRKIIRKRDRAKVTEVKTRTQYAHANYLVNVSSVSDGQSCVHLSKAQIPTK